LACVASKIMKIFSPAFVALSCLVLISCGEDRPAVQLESQTLLVQRNIEVIADEYLAAVLLRKPEMGTTYSTPGARHDALYDNSLAALTAWQAQEDYWLLELESIGAPAETGSRDWVTYGVLHEALAGSIA